MHKDVNEIIDLDSLIQLYDRAINELLSIPKNTFTISVPSSDEDESDSSDHPMYVFMYLFSIHF